MKRPNITWLTTRPIAHRGLHDKSTGVIENTSDAFAAAVQNNYAIECDLQISSDGEAMVFHDDEVDRLLEAEGNVKSFSVAELKSRPFKATRNRMQTLSELLEQVDGRVPLVIELKSHWDGNLALAHRAIDVLQGYRGAFALMSFDPKHVAEVAVKAPNMIRGITADRCEDSYYDQFSEQARSAMRNFSHLNETRPDFVSYHFKGLPFAPVQTLRAAGMPVITWTIKSAAEAEQALRFSDQITFEGFAA